MLVFHCGLLSLSLTIIFRRSTILKSLMGNFCFKNFLGLLWKPSNQVSNRIANLFYQILEQYS